jgi:ACR3 family arsenite transporter
MSGTGAEKVSANQMSVFERYLTLWVALCIVVGVVLGHYFLTCPLPC